MFNGLEQVCYGRDGGLAELTSSSLPLRPARSSVVSGSLADPIRSHLVLYSFLREAYKTLPNESVVSFLQSVESGPSTSSSAVRSSSTSAASVLADHLADALWQVDAEIEDMILTATSADTPAEPSYVAGLEGDRTRWTELCKAVFAVELIPTALYDRFDYPFLERIGASAGTGMQTMVKKSTRLGTVTLSVPRDPVSMRSGRASSSSPVLVLVRVRRQLLAQKVQPPQGVIRRILAPRDPPHKQGDPWTGIQPRDGLRSRR